MVVREFYKTRKDGVNLYESYSTENLYIQKVGTEEKYDKVIDVEDAPYEYIETNEKIVEDEENLENQGM